MRGWVTRENTVENTGKYISPGDIANEALRDIAQENCNLINYKKCDKTEVGGKMFHGNVENKIAILGAFDRERADPRGFSSQSKLSTMSTIP